LTNEHISIHLFSKRKIIFLSEPSKNYIKQYLPNYFCFNNKEDINTVKKLGYKVFDIIKYNHNYIGKMSLNI
jgi:hypothetical protein